MPDAYRCRRCDWTPQEPPSEYGSPRGQLLEHAHHTGHPICVVDGKHSLDRDHDQTCPPCVGRTRTDLADVANMHARLPALLVHVRYPGDTRPDKSHGGSDGHPIPGGDALVLEAGGGVGLPRRLTRGDHVDRGTVDYPELIGRSADGQPIRHPEWTRRPEPATGYEHAADEHPTDPPSVLQLVTGWEDTVRRHYRDRPAGAPDVAAAVGYLTRHLDAGFRIAQTLPWFVEFAREVRSVRDRLAEVTGLSDRPEVAPAACFECGCALVKDWTDQGLAEAWRCRGCGAEYDTARYWLAVRSKLAADAAEAEAG